MWRHPRRRTIGHWSFGRGELSYFVERDTESGVGVFESRFNDWVSLSILKVNSATILHSPFFPLLQKLFSALDFLLSFFIHRINKPVSTTGSCCLRLKGQSFSYSLFLYYINFSLLLIFFLVSCFLSFFIYLDTSILSILLSKLLSFYLLLRI
jgi:hypothetical protein